MKSIDKRTIIIATITLIAGLLAGWIIFSDNSTESAESHDHEKTIAGEETVWTCSMHPQVRQGEPGDCPICGMDLIPLEGEEDTELDPMAVSMSSTAMKLASVSTAVVDRMNPVKRVQLSGKVQADERLVYSQSSHIPGRIEKLQVNFTGEYVKKGQAIAYVYSPDLITAQEELFEAQKISETQPQLFAAAKEKLKNWKLTQKQIEAILRSGEIKEEFPVLADVSGYVIEKSLKLGDYVRTGEAIYQITDLSKVWVLFDVYESDIPWVNRGDKVEFTIASLPGEQFTGTISYIDPVIDPDTRVARARIEFNNSGGKLKPEMFASGVVEARLDKTSNALVVPKTAVMWTGKRSVVYIRTTSDQGVGFVMREVVLGPSLGNHYIVESGLKEGEEIAVHGTFSIDAAAQLAGKPSMMSPEGGKVMTGHDHGGMTDESNDKPKKTDHAGHDHGSQQAMADPEEQSAPSVSTDEFEVKGNCGMCKSRIEKAAKSVEGVASATWQQETGMLHLEYDQEKTTVHKVQKTIAEAGHDTPMHKAEDDVYNELPACCKYERGEGKSETDGHEGHQH